MPQEKKFNWQQAKGINKFHTDYTEEERTKLTKIYEETLMPICEHEIVEGTIIDMSKRDIVLKVGFKSDTLLPLGEFRDMPDLKIGDTVEVYVEKQENANDELVVSRKKAKLVRGWEKIQFAADNDEIIQSLVKRRTKGGLIVDIYGIEAFLPGSQIDVKPIRDFDAFVDQDMEVKIVKINYTNDNLVVSHKVLIEGYVEQQKLKILNNLEKGQILEGIVKNMTHFGVFIDLGGVDGLLHITDIAWSRVNHPEDVLQLGQKIKVVVIDFDEPKKRISLGMKQLTPHPWKNLPESVQVGSKIKGKIVNIADYGAFLELMPGVEGLIHISEISWTQHLNNIHELLKVGDEVEAVILTLDRKEKKISLGIKQVTEDPWSSKDILEKYAIKTKHKGTVRNITNFGVFIELEAGIDGLLHIGDMSWTKKITHPSELFKLNDTVEVLILEINQTNKRLSLGLKQLEKDPWETCEEIFKIGSVCKGTIIQKVTKGAILELPYGIKGFVATRHLIKVDGKEAKVEELLDFQVIGLSKQEKKIFLSHTATFSKSTEKTKKKSTDFSKFQNINTNEESTLGGLEVFSDLKKQIKDQKQDKKG